MADHLKDEDLLRLAARGDEAAFEALYDRRQTGVFRFALHMSGNRDIAEEVTQEAFIALARDGRTYNEQRGTVAAYLYGIARNLVLRRLERSRDHADLGEDGDKHAAAGGDGPLGSLLRSEAVEAVRRAVLSLPESYREAVALCDLQELSYEEAAQALGCPVGTIRSKLNRGRALLAEKLRAAKGCFA